MRRETLVPAAIALALALLVLVAYWPVHAHGFVNYDDPVYLTENPYVARGLEPHAMAWVFTHALAANYHPLTWLSHQLDVELFGLERPGAHHMVSVALHALNAVLVFLLVRAATRRDLGAALVAALFALHPLRVESVAWASERKDVLCATFFLATLLAYLCYARAPSAARYALVVVGTALALLAKPMAVSLPGVLLLLDFWPLGRLGSGKPTDARPPLRRVLLEKVPLVALAALAAVTTVFAQRVGGATGEANPVPLALRTLNALRTSAVYLGETLWPRSLAVFYPHPAIGTDSPLRALLAPALAAAALLAAVSVIAWVLRRSRPWLLAGWAWYLLMLVPVAGIVQVGAQAHADRYTYLPTIGVAWIVVFAGAELAARGPLARMACMAVASLAVAALGLATRAQVAVWRDTPALFEHALAVTGDNYMAHAALGIHYLDEGDRARAEEHLREAVRLYPLDALSHTQLGRLYLDSGRLDLAEQELGAARKLWASKWTRYQLGRLAFLRGDRAAAETEFRAALALDPSLTDARVNLGQVLLLAKRPDEAEACFRDVLALVPDQAGALNGLGALVLDRDPAEAERLFARAVEADPDYADARHNLGLALERLGRVEEARAQQAEERRLREARRAPQ